MVLVATVVAVVVTVALVVVVAVVVVVLVVVVTVVVAAVGPATVSHFTMARAPPMPHMPTPLLSLMKPLSPHLDPQEFFTSQ